VSTAIVVPGHHGPERLRDLVHEAELIAESTHVDAVVFTGWSRGGGPTEAELMHDAWGGPAVELVVEPTATVTAENAARTIPLLLERGIQRAIVVCAPLHLYRTRYFFTRLFGAYGIETEFRVARTRRSVGALLWELGAVTVCRRQLRTARAELADVMRS
jgi:uncharacterized SAM-binding protein YcdF (DUF218 family)